MPSLLQTAASVGIREVINAFTSANIQENQTQLSCPFPDHDDHKPSFSIYPHTNSYYCHACKKHGNSLEFVKTYFGINAEGAAKKIVEHFNLTYTPSKTLDPGYQQYVDVYEYVAGFYYALNGHKDARKHDYWAKRMLDSLSKEYKLGYCPEFFMHNETKKVMSFKTILMLHFTNIKEEVLDSYGLYDKHGNSIMSGRFVIPIRDKRGNVVGFSGRSLDPNQPKYINTAENNYFKKRFILFNGNNALYYDYIFVVEGPLDALSLVASGIPNVVALMGTSFTEYHHKILKDKTIILALDQDDVGKETTARIIEKNPEIPYRVFIPGFEYKDFNEALMAGVSIEISDEEYKDFTYGDKKSLRKNRRVIYGVEFMIRYLKEHLDLSDPIDADQLYARVNRLAKYSGPVSRRRFSIIIKRLFQGVKVYAEFSNK